MPPFAEVVRVPLAELRALRSAQASALATGGQLSSIAAGEARSTFTV
jgi:hypothetical protein